MFGLPIVCRCQECRNQECTDNRSCVPHSQQWRKYLGSAIPALQYRYWQREQMDSLVLESRVLSCASVNKPLHLQLAAACVPLFQFALLRLAEPKHLSPLWPRTHRS